MNADIFDGTAKQLCHLALRELYGIVLQTDLQPDRRIRLIDDDFVLGFRHDDFMAMIGELGDGCTLYP